jgi:NADH-quinone oxidoreductase subunit H
MPSFYRDPRDLFLPPARIAFVLFFACAVLACGRDVAPPLVQVTEIAPRDVEVGDRLAISGSGFEPGRRAHVTFHGTLRRPGERLVTGAEIAAEGVVIGPERVEVAFTDELEAAFCGAGDRAAHTMFQGDVEVAFAAAVRAAPPVAGSLTAATLDIDPPRTSGAIRAEREEEGRKAAAFAGLKLSAAAPPSGGLLVEAVEPGSPADAAGVTNGDALVALDGLRVASLSDLRPPRGAGPVTVGLRRGSDPRTLTRRISFAGFEPGAPADLEFAAGIVLAAAAIVVFFFAPTRARTAWLDREVAASLRGASAVRVVLASFREAGSGALLTAVFAAISAVLGLLPFSGYLVAADLDIGVLFLVPVTALVVVALFTGGSERYGLVASLRQALLLVACAASSALGVLTVVVSRGSLRPLEIVRAQGGWPWQWGAFHDPASLVVCAVFGAASLLASGRGDRAEPSLTPRAKTYAFAERATLLVLSSLAAVLFLGGWELPGLSLVEQEGRTDLAFLGASVLLAKTWLVFLAVLWIRHALPRPGIGRSSRLAWRWLLPAAAIACSSSVAAAHVPWLRDAASRAEWIVSAALFAVACLALVAWVRRIAFHLKNRDGELHLNPFL